jgi:hypothetical protein
MNDTRRPKPVPIVVALLSAAALAAVVIWWMGVKDSMFAGPEAPGTPVAGPAAAPAPAAGATGASDDGRGGGGTEPSWKGKPLSALLGELGDPRERLYAALALGAVELPRDADVKRVVDALSRTLVGHDDGFARAAASSLVKRGAPGRAALLAAFDADEGRDDIPGMAIAALGDAGEAAVPRLIKLLDCADRTRAVHASLALGNVGAPAIPPLVRATRTFDGDSPTQVRATALMALLSMGPAARSAVPAIRERLGDPNEGVRRVAGEALRAVGGYARVGQEAPATSHVGGGGGG